MVKSCCTYHTSPMSRCERPTECCSTLQQFLTKYEVHMYVHPVWTLVDHPSRSCRFTDCFRGHRTHDLVPELVFLCCFDSAYRLLATTVQHVLFAARSKFLPQQQQPQNKERKA